MAGLEAAGHVSGDGITRGEGIGELAKAARSHPGRRAATFATLPFTLRWLRVPSDTPNDNYTTKKYYLASIMIYLEILGVLVGLVYLFLELRASVWLWLAGIVMPLIYIYVYYQSGFYADVGINIYYAIAGVYGWTVWYRGKDAPGDQTRKELPITHTPRGRYLLLFVATMIFFAIIAWILIKFTDSTVPYGDSFTTALSIVGLWMLARKYVEQWLVWCVVDVICCGLYLYKGLYPTAALYGFYGVMSIYGYYKWLKMMKVEDGRVV